MKLLTVNMVIMVFAAIGQAEERTFTVFNNGFICTQFVKASLNRGVSTYVCDVPIRKILQQSNDPFELVSLPQVEALTKVINNEIIDLANSVTEYFDKQHFNDKQEKSAMRNEFQLALQAAEVRLNKIVEQAISKSSQEITQQLLVYINSKIAKSNSQLKLSNKETK